MANEDELSSIPYALAVDDEPFILMHACDILADAGFRCLDATSADEALARLEERADDVTLLFTDVQMPGSKNGFALAREVAHRWPHISIVVASGALQPDPGELPDGAVFLTKPFNADTVYAYLQEILPDGQQPEPLKHLAR